MTRLINATTSKALVEGRKPYSGCRNSEEGKEDRVVGRSAAVDAIIPESQDVATPQYRRTAHDFPSLSHPRRFCSPFRRTLRQNLAQLLPSFFRSSPPFRCEEYYIQSLARLLGHSGNTFFIFIMLLCIEF